MTVLSAAYFVHLSGWLRLAYSKDLKVRNIEIKKQWPII